MRVHGTICTGTAFDVLNLATPNHSVLRSRLKVPAWHSNMFKFTILLYTTFVRTLIFLWNPSQPYIVNHSTHGCMRWYKFTHGYIYVMIWSIGIVAWNGPCNLYAKFDWILNWYCIVTWLWPFVKNSKSCDGRSIVLKKVLYHKVNLNVYK